MYLNLPRFTSCTNSLPGFLLQHFLQCPFFPHPWQVASLARQCYLEWAGFVPQQKKTLSFCLTMLFIFRHLVTIWPLRWFPAFLMLCLHFVNLCWSLLYCSYCCRCFTESLHNSSLAAFGNRFCTWELQFRLLVRRRVQVFLQTLLINLWII